MPRRFILTGAPGAGKTALIRALEARGFDTVEEAATDVISLQQASGTEEPWTDPRFIERIAGLQAQREAAPMRDDLRFSDRSVFCTLALAEFLGHAVPPAVEAQADRSRSRFEPRVLFVDLMGTITPTAARRISLAESQRFAAVHEAVYRHWGFDLVHIEPAPLGQRLAAVLAVIG